MAVCDHRYKILYADIGAYGHQADSGVYEKSSFKQHLETGLLNIPGPQQLPNSEIVTDHFFVGDGAFPLGVNLMKPYGGNDLSHDKKIYNYRFLSVL